MTRSRNDEEYKPRDQYYTPPWVFESLAIEFDVDVCAPAGGIAWIPAKTHYHEAIDGLNQEWSGKVWMNPPYSKPKPWIDKFVQHGSGIGLIAMSRSNAFYALWNNEQIRFAVPEKHMMFVTPEGKKLGVFMPVCFIAVGDECVEALIKSGLGHVR